MSTSDSTDTREATPLIDTLQTKGADVTAAVKKLLHDGNIRRIVVKNEHDHTIIEIPVTAGLAFAVVAPVLVAVAAVAAVVENCKIEVHRVDEHVFATQPR